MLQINVKGPPWIIFYNSNISQMNKNNTKSPGKITPVLLMSNQCENTWRFNSSRLTAMWEQLTSQLVLPLRRSDIKTQELTGLMQIYEEITSLEGNNLFLIKPSLILSSFLIPMLHFPGFPSNSHHFWGSVPKSEVHSSVFFLANFNYI